MNGAVPQTQAQAPFHQVLGRPHLTNNEVGVFEHRELAKSEAEQIRESGKNPFVFTRTVKGDADLQKLVNRTHEETKAKRPKRLSLLKSLKECEPSFSTRPEMPNGQVSVGSRCDLNTGKIEWVIDRFDRFPDTKERPIPENMAVFHRRRIELLAMWRDRLVRELDSFRDALDMLDVKLSHCSSEKMDGSMPVTDENLSMIDCFVSARFMACLQSTVQNVKQQRENLLKGLIKSALDCWEFEKQDLEGLCLQMQRRVLQAHWQKKLVSMIPADQLTAEMAKVQDPTNPPPELNRFRPFTDIPPNFFHQMIPETFDAFAEKHQS